MRRTRPTEIPYKGLGFVEISGGPVYEISMKCGIYIKHPRDHASGVRDWAIASQLSHRHAAFDDRDEYFYDNSGNVKLASSVAALIHDSWHEDCIASMPVPNRWPAIAEWAAKFTEWKERSERCHLQGSLSCLVEPSLFRECDIGLASAVIRGWHGLYILHMPRAAQGITPMFQSRQWGPLADTSRVEPASLENSFKFAFSSAISESPSPLPLSLSNLHLTAEDHAAHRTAHITPANTIRDPYTVFPRRLWDLDINRVVPAHLCYRNTLQGPATPPVFAAISHSWRPPSELVYVATAINAFAWPVPLPIGLDLEALREEIQAHMSTRYRYVWLDVLCLRQVHNVPAADIRISPTDDAAWHRRRHTTDNNSWPWHSTLSLAQDPDGRVRSDELAIDVPTIGNVYRLASQVLRYFNGLGQPFSTTGWDSPTHWLNRAWTLQEHVPLSIDIPGAGAMIPGNHLNLRVTKGGLTRRVRDHLYTVHNGVVRSPTLLGLVAEMGRRFATNDVDKLAGLSYALLLPELPTYAGAAGVEVAWRRCLAVLPPRWVAELFFNCPLVPVHVNHASCQWTPTWEALVGLPPSFVPYATIPEDGGNSVLLPINGRPGSMEASVACIFLRSIARVEGTDVDYVVYVDVSDITKRETETQRPWNVFVSHDGLTEVDLSAAEATGSQLLMLQLKGEVRADSETHGVKTWVLFLLLPEVGEDSYSRWERNSGPWRFRKLGVFRSDVEPPALDNDAMVHAAVDGDTHLRSSDTTFCWRIGRRIDRLLKVPRLRPRAA